MRLICIDKTLISQNETVTLALLIEADNVIKRSIKTKAAFATQCLLSSLNIAIVYNIVIGACFTANTGVSTI